MPEKNYHVLQSLTKLELEVASTKSLTWLIALTFQFVLFLILIGLSLLVIYKNFSYASLILGTLLILISIYFAKNSFDTFFWVKNGREFLEIDLTKETFLYKKIGRIVFDEINGDLQDLSNFKWCPDNDEYIDIHPRFGTNGGKICFWLKNKKHRFAISLSKTAAKNCIVELNSFLKHTKK